MTALFDENKMKNKNKKIIWCNLEGKKKHIIKSATSASMPLAIYEELDLIKRYKRSYTSYELFTFSGRFRIPCFIKSCMHSAAEVTSNLGLQKDLICNRFKDCKEHTKSTPTLVFFPQAKFVKLPNLINELPTIK